MGLAMTSQPLTDVDLDRLDEILANLGDEDAMTVEELDGFLAALICGPVLVQPSQYLPVIMGRDAAFADISAAQEFMSLIMRHWNTIAATLNSGDIYLPLFLELEDSDDLANDWAIGFRRGMEFGKEEWSVLFDDEDHGGLIVPIFALAHEHDPDPSMRPYEKPIDAGLRTDLITEAAAAANGIFRYFRERRLAETGPSGSALRRATPKIGRNDPSGRKYKHCCGKSPAH